MPNKRAAGIVRHTVPLPADLSAALVARAVDTRTSVAAVIRDAIRAHLGEK